MLTALRSRWHDVLHGLWFVPGVVAAAFAVLAIVLLLLDRAAGPAGIDVLFGGSPEAALSILSTIAGSVITVAGLAFSITIITLQLVSQQFSPRATRTFLGDRATQVAAGVFLGVFVYCLLVLRAVREEEFGEFVPGLSVATAIGLGVLGIGVLLYFINHTAQSIKVTSIAARIAKETLAAIDRLYPEPYGEPVEGTDELVERWESGDEPSRAYPKRPGYVQRIDLDALVAELPDQVERVHVVVAPGDFVVEEQPLVAVWPAGAGQGAELQRAVRDAVDVNDEREVSEDAGFGIQQLADIALRAISPSVNDPSTAVTCVGYIAACLDRLAGRRFPAERRRFRDDRLEVVARRAGFDLFVAQGLDDVGAWAAESPRVVKALLSAAARAAAAAAASGARDRVPVLLRAAEHVAEPALEAARTGRDRAELQEALEEVERAAEGVGGEAPRVAVGGPDR